MFRFENPDYLWLLLVIPLLIAVRYLAFLKKRKQLRLFGEKQLVERLMIGVSRRRPFVKFLLQIIALSLLIIVLARPQLGAKISHEQRNGIEVVIALDISNSMLATDVTPSRLEKSKLLIANMVDNFSNDKIGLVVFAGDAFIQLPITSDYVSAKMFLQSIDPSQIATQGTDIAHALDLAMSSFTQQERIGRAIIVITDGEDHEGQAVEAAKAAHKKGINVYVLGVGDSAGAPVPTADGYLTDGNGQTVMTALNEDMCRQIAEAGKGAYIHVDNTSDAQKRLNAELDRLQKGETDATIYSQYDEQFQAFCILILLLLVIDVLLSERKNKLFQKLNPLKKRRQSAEKATATILLLFLFSVSMNAQTDRKYIRQGNRIYRSQASGDRSQEGGLKAETEYSKALAKNQANSQALYNLGCALMLQQKDSAAIEQFQKAAQRETNKFRRSKSFHNIGVICQKHQMYGEAIEAYKESLRDNPTDNETRYNLALCQRQQRQQNNNQQQQQGSDNDDNKDKQQQQQQQQKDNPSQQSPEQMSRDNAEQLLNAAMQQERETQQRMKKAMRQPQSRRLQKNW